jgi:DNA polymerase III epsilon subunit-like protein
MLHRASIRTNPEMIETVLRYADTLYPTSESMHQYLQRLEADDGSLGVLVPALTQLVKADEIYTDRERQAVATLLQEIENIRAENERRAISVEANLQANVVGEFVAVDVETANSDISSICSIGLVHFKDGKITKQLKLPINPECDFDPINISIHGIRPDDVKAAQVMRDVFPIVSSSLSNLFVVHHTHFDRTALSQVAQQHGFAEISCRWIDSASVARRAWKRFSIRGYGLKNLAEEFSISFKHHDACEDARVAGLVLLRAIAETGIPLGEWHDQAAKTVAASTSISMTPEAQRISRVVNGVTLAKREKRFDEAVRLLLAEIEHQETEAKKTGLGVAPWYYEQLAIVYRKLKRHDAELVILERYDQQPKAPGAGPQKLKERLEKVRQKIAKLEQKNAKAILH